MTGFTQNQNRHVIPRWRTLEKTAKMGEIGPSTLTPEHTAPQNHDAIAKTRATWERCPTIYSASDFIGAAIFYNNPHEAIDAIEFLNRESAITEPLRESIELALPDYFNTPPPAPTPACTIREEAELRIRELREKLHIEPKRPFTQVDLALAHTILGHNEKAKQHITIAQQLAPNDRHVLRSASRFWLHDKDYDQAHEILTQSDRTRHDPWLMAAEVAIGNFIDKKPVFVKEAQNLIADDSLRKSHISELASAVATIDWNHGAISKAKKLFNQSLEEPTENSLAQAVWMSSQDNFFNPNTNIQVFTNAHEAKAHHHYINKNWKQAVEQCDQWQKDQPFSPAPGIDGSFISILAFKDYSLAKQFAENGLIANPDDFLLLNNLAVALINLNEFDEAQTRLSQINPTTTAHHDLASLSKTITTGLLQYRTGNVEQGRQSYLSARSLAEEPAFHQTDLLARATATHAIEEFPHQTDNYSQLLNDAFELLKGHNTPACDILQQQLLDLTDPSD